MMKNQFKYAILLLLSSLVFISSCSEDDKDEEKPTITVDYTDGFPQACQELQRGSTYTFKASTSDNLGLASYSIDIHNNFDHHTHDDQEEVCEMSPDKDAINPFIYLDNFSISESPTDYELSEDITIPTDIDTGDYHCSISIIDVTGWQSQTTIDIKIID